MKKNHAAQFAPVNRIVVSSKVGSDKKLNDYNDKAVSTLYHAFKSIVNSNGETTFGLTDLEQKVVKAGDAYVFLPIPSEIKHLRQPQKEELFREIFKAASLVVGKQTKDPNLRLNPADPESPQKPIILVNHNNCYDGFYELMQNLHRLGTITQDPSTLCQRVDNVDAAIKILKDAHKQKNTVIPSGIHSHKAPIKSNEEQDPDEKRKPDFNVCVFCSASTKNPALLNLAHDMGTGIAEEGWGVISGLGCTGMMGQVVEGAAEVIEEKKKGWVAGSNLPRIIHMEGLPSYYDKLWLTDDIYKRMEVMIKNSQAFVLLPGGMGTVQELMALLLLKYADKNGDHLMSDKKFGNKPIILVNPEIVDREGHKVEFWKPLVDMARSFGFERDITVVASAEEAKEVLLKAHQRSSERSAARG